MTRRLDQNKFFNFYKSKSIIFPDAVLRYFKISMEEAYKICEKKKKEGILRNLYTIKCPNCNRRINDERYYSLRDIDTDVEIGCIHCDYGFIPKLDRDVMVLYEKI